MRYIAKEQPAPAGPRATLTKTFGQREEAILRVISKLPPNFKLTGVDPATGNPVRIQPVSSTPNQIENIQEYTEKMRAALTDDATDGGWTPHHAKSNNLPKQRLNRFIHRNQAILPAGAEV